MTSLKLQEESFYPFFLIGPVLRLNKYYGLVELAVRHGIFKKVSTRIELPDGRKVYEKNINDDPKRYYTDEILQQLDKAAGVEFKYGSATTVEAIEDETTTEDS